MNIFKRHSGEEQIDTAVFGLRDVIYKPDESPMPGVLGMLDNIRDCGLKTALLVTGPEIPKSATLFGNVMDRIDAARNGGVAEDAESIRTAIAELLTDTKSSVERTVGFHAISAEAEIKAATELGITVVRVTQEQIDSPPPDVVIGLAGISKYVTDLRPR